MTFPLSSLERLADNLIQGRGVFFIGSGFSLDSEPNSAYTILARIIARLEALIIQLSKVELYEKFMSMFYVEGHNNNKVDPQWVQCNIGRYYEINDWICSAYDIVLGEYKSKSKTLTNIKIFFDDVNNSESNIFLRVSGKHTLPPTTPLNETLFISYLSLGPRYRGKAMFLDTVGFDNPKIMAGDAITLPTLLEVSNAYQGVLKPRHFILARLAREGLCPVLITTNFDLLLEGGYRLSGLKPLDNTNSSLAYFYEFFRVIGDPNTFFDSGDGHRTAMIVKIHGCAHHYRTLRSKVMVHKPSKHAVESWRRYLDDVVYTYREIQNWRDDAWARDFVRTQARTRTLAFIGYSGIDPVIHDTLRTVYEEMSRQRLQDSPTKKPEEATCYFFDIQNKSSFHGEELLRSASRARGVPNPPLDEHPNLIRFYTSAPKSPMLDEMLTWTFHRTFRRRQKELLHAHLSTVASLLLGHPLAVSLRDSIFLYFDQLVKNEFNIINNSTRNQLRDDLRHVTLWSGQFHRLLLQEYHLAQECAATGATTTADRYEHRYEPLIDHPLHAAWGVVVEIALRRMIAKRQGKLSQWTDNDYWWHPVAGVAPPYPGLKLSFGLQPAPTLLFIVPQGVRIAGLHTRLRGLSVGICIFWELPYSVLFWPTGRTNPVYPTHGRHASLHVPSAQDLLSWAGEKRSPNNSHEFLP
ncbi:MAG: SIR2 family protein [Magnetococcales bacterium]|nr:SIR2 family protein [Magnetococcales bacterium]